MYRWREGATAALTVILKLVTGGLIILLIVLSTVKSSVPGLPFA